MVSPTAREIPRTNAAATPEMADGQDDPEGGLEPRRAERERPVPQAVRHGPHRILAERSDVGDDHDAHHDPGAEDVEPGQTGDERLQQGVTNSRAKKPYTTVGTPLRSSRVGLTTSRVRGEANSLR